ncbi:DsbA family protein [Micromonospora craniellae]|uniref:Disulfide bond formation protein DsbA n=1 Tax=Micromonospora craniellae TaxID=2294034 RepID=A0A372G244_9ACTN|nr:thioredoxin domain-containing protein [Micromonospora craniellae]QOC92811.1 thioredoxin domain-containing protein [Micromonospora craniellae]RFS46954.1 disulfide bond formation protein DsbA [Micromonospora craniellae]
MTRNLRLTLAMILVVILVMIGLTAINRNTGSRSSGQPVDPAVLVRDDSHRLTTAADGKVTLVEFLDFECEACGAVYPAVSELLDTYQDRITFVVRYFPIPSHPNAELAARAAEAAANQGRFAEMYTVLFENQEAWGRQRAPQTETFVGYARTLGLDVETFQRDLDDPATAARVARDRADGETAGVQGTPTFFLNGRQLTEVRTQADMSAAIDAALAG